MRESVIILIASIVTAIAFIHGGSNSACNGISRGSIVAVVNCPVRMTDMKWSF